MARRPGPPPARAQPTLGQATGGRPGRVPPAGQTAPARPAAPRPPTAPGLGLGLGLNPRQRGAFQQAAQQGQGAAYLGQNPMLARRVNQLDPTGWKARNVQNFIGSYGQRQPYGGPAAAPPAPAAAPPAPLPQPPPQAPSGGMPGMVGGNMADQMGGMAGGGGGPWAVGAGGAPMWTGPNPNSSAGFMGDMGTYGRGGGMADMFGAGGPFGGYSPAMQNVLAARMQGGGFGGAQGNYGGGNPMAGMYGAGAMGQPIGGGTFYNPSGGFGGSLGRQSAFASNQGAAQANQQQATGGLPRTGYTPTGTGMGQGQGSPV